LRKDWTNKPHQRAHNKLI